MIDLPPDCASRFEAVKVLSSGGFGTAVLCRQVSLDRPAVVKLLHQDGSRTHDHVERFLAEARVTSKLVHPGVVTVLDSGFAAGVPWNAYEFIDGPTVRQILDRGLPPLQVAVQMALPAPARTVTPITFPGSGARSRSSPRDRWSVRSR